MQELKVTKLINSNGLELEVLNLGASIISLKVPDREGKLVNVVVGLENETDYINEPYYLGKTVGRYAGRISRGGFNIGSKEYQLEVDNGVHLHGGENGFSNQFWAIEHVEKGVNPSVTLSYYSKHLEEGYPGNVKVTVRYQLTNENSLKILYKAATDMTTHINLTNHSYFNLNGNGSVLDQELVLNGKGYLEVDEQLIPTGTMVPIKNSRFDFLEQSIIGRKDFIGFDDTVILNDSEVHASFYSEKTGIQMKVRTNQPAMVVYTPKEIKQANFKNGAMYTEYPAICFEAQKFPDTPNQNDFPSTLVLPMEKYINETIFDFNRD